MKNHHFLSLLRPSAISSFTFLSSYLCSTSHYSPAQFRCPRLCFHCPLPSKHYPLPQFHYMLPQLLACSCIGGLWSDVMRRVFKVVIPLKIETISGTKSSFKLLTCKGFMVLGDSLFTFVISSFRIRALTMRGFLKSSKSRAIL